jgi:hypothetical protein
MRLGIPGPLAQAQADHVGWHQTTWLVQRSVFARVVWWLAVDVAGQPGARWAGLGA